MLKKLRLKFVAVCMALITAVLAVMIGTAVRSARERVERISADVLSRVIAEQPGKRSIGIGGGEVALPYFTVEVWQNTAYVTGGTYGELEDTEALTAILSACMEKPEAEGMLPEYNLRYLRRDKGLYSRAAFVDMSMEIAALREMLASWLLTALASLLPLFGVSVLLSQWAVGPVERAWKQQRQFLSDASHELKTPLTVILSNAGMLEETDLPDRPRQWAENILSESRRMKTLVEEMLALARADNAAKPEPFGEISLSGVAEDCALAFEPVAFEAGKPLESALAPGVTVLGDGEKLRRLISVLLDNAIKYGAEGGTLRLSLEAGDRQAKLTVTNPGEPIPPEVLPHLFERFYRGDASRGERPGFGLGLSIAGAIAREHRGTLKAQSGPEGTSFLFTMPLKNTRKSAGSPAHQ